MSEQSPAFEALESRTLFAATWLYGVDSGASDNSSNLFRIDPATGVIEDVGETRFIIKDIAFTPDGQLWGITKDRLVRIDRNYGFAFDVGKINFAGGTGGDNNQAPPALNGLTSDAGGRLFASVSTGKLIRFMPRMFDEGRNRPINATERGDYENKWLSSGDLVFDTDNTLLATANRANGPSALMLLNPRTGRAYPIGAIGGRAAEGLAVGPDNQLYGVIRGDQANPTIVRINRDTGRGVVLSNVNNVDGIVGLAASPIGASPLAFILDKAMQASPQTFAQLYNAGVKYSAVISTTLDNGAGADIYIDLSDYYSSLYKRNLSPEGRAGWVSVWVDKHDPIKGSAVDFSLGAVPMRFQGAATDPTGQFIFGRDERGYPYRRDPLVKIDTVRIEGDPDATPGLDGRAVSLYGAQRAPRGPADDSLRLARFEVTAARLDALFNDAIANLGTADFLDPDDIARLLADTIVVESGDTVAINAANFANPAIARPFTPTDRGVTPGPDAGNAFNLGSLNAASRAQRFGVGWVGVGTSTNYYSFTLTGSGVVNITLPRLDGDVDLFLERPAGTVIATGTSTGPGVSAPSISRTLTAGTYFIRVESASDYDAGYTVRVATGPGTAPAVAAILASQPRSTAAMFANMNDTHDDLDLLGGEALATL